MRTLESSDAEKEQAATSSTDKDKHDQASEKLAHLNDEIKQAQTKATDIIKEAQQEKHKLLSEAEEEIKEKKQVAIEQGFHEGFKKGEKAGEASYDQVIDQMNQLVRKTEISFKEKIVEAEEEILQIAIKSAEKIIHSNLTNDKELFVNVIKEAVEEVSDQPEISIYVHPHTYEMVSKHKQTLNEIVSEHATVSVYTKKDLKEYDCFIDSTFGRIDTGIDTRIEQLKDHLFQLIKG